MPIAQVLRSKVEETSAEQTARALGVSRSAILSTIAGVAHQATIYLVETRARELGWLDEQGPEA